jgi:hypothetical protein
LNYNEKQNALLIADDEATKSIVRPFQALDPKQNEGYQFVAHPTITTTANLWFDLIYFTRALELQRKTPRPSESPTTRRNQSSAPSAL